jgi:hypothetical protein
MAAVRSCSDGPVLSLHSLNLVQQPIVKALHRSEVAPMHLPALVEVNVIFRARSGDVPLKQDKFCTARIDRLNLKSWPSRRFVGHEIPGNFEVLVPGRVNSTPRQAIL